MSVDESVLKQRLATLDLEQKVRLLTGSGPWALHAEPAAGLRRLVVSDGPAGVRGERWDARDTSANVPSPTALSATWDEDLVERVGRLLAVEARRKGVDVLLAPTVNLHRSPYGGRHFECFSEDPWLTARIGVAYVRGLQECGVGATVKHFVANDSETERFTLDARVDERTLRELYLLPFEEIVGEAGAWSVMAAYNSVNGHTMTESPMLREILHDEWGFDGVVMSDWHAHRTVEAAGNAALDMSMPGPTSPWVDGLADAVRDGRVSEAALDDKVLRILRMAARVGALDGVEPAAPAPSAQDVDVAAELRATAAASFVLTRNEGALLPLDPASLGTVAVIGPNAAEARTLGGGSATVFPPYTVSPLQGLREALGADRVVHAVGARASERVPLAAGPLVTDPETGEPGMHSAFLDAGGRVARAEHRATGAVNVMSFGADADLAGVVAVELRGRLTAEVDGEHEVGCSGSGHFVLTVDGRQVLDTTISLPPGADPAALLHPPVESVRVPLTAGQVVDVVLRYDGAGDGQPLPGAVLNLHADRPHPPADEEMSRAVALARQADVAVVVVGTTEEVESEGFDRTSLALPGAQDELVRRVVEANPRTVVVVNSGAPVLLPWAEDVPSVLLVWFGGQELGHALSDVLLGAAEPGGRLPTTWPSSEDGLPPVTPVDGVLPYDEGLFVGYRAYDRDGREPLYRFGHGLGYTTWAWESVEGPSSVAAGEDVPLRVTLRNTGDRPGREVVQVYAARPGSSVERPPRSLVGFAGVRAAAGETVTVPVTVPVKALRHWDSAGSRWVVEPGALHLEVGPRVGEAALTADVELT